MSQNLNVAAIQLDIVWADPEVNLRNAEQAIARLPEGTDLCVLPEMFTTGFVTDPGHAMRLAEEGNDGQSIAAMRRWATTFNMAICGSVIVRNGDKLYNRAYFIEPSGDMTVYDKHHLFGLSGESSVYTMGRKRIPTVRFRGWNIAFAICFDLRFPGWLRNNGDTYDLLVIMANWPDSRQYAWEHLLIARAIENQAYVVGCNRSGIDDWGVYSMTSQIYDAKGQPTSNKITGQAISASLDLGKLNSFRHKFPLIGEADNYII